jgi:hypothetical protein
MLSLRFSLLLGHLAAFSALFFSRSLHAVRRVRAGLVPGGTAAPGRDQSSRRGGGQFSTLYRRPNLRMTSGLIVTSSGAVAPSWRERETGCSSLSFLSLAFNTL